MIVAETIDNSTTIINNIKKDIKKLKEKEQREQEKIKNAKNELKCVNNGIRDFAIYKQKKIPIFDLLIRTEINNKATCFHHYITIHKLKPNLYSDISWKILFMHFRFEDVEFLNKFLSWKFTDILEIPDIEDIKCPICLEWYDTCEITTEDNRKIVYNKWTKPFTCDHRVCYKCMKKIDKCPLCRTNKSQVISYGRIPNEKYRDLLKITGELEHNYQEITQIINSI